MRAPALAFAAMMAWAPLAARAQSAADPKPVSPYIDQLKEEMRERGERTDPVPSGQESYTESIKRKLKEKDAASETPESDEKYVDQIKREMREAGEPDGPAQSQGYTDAERERLGPAQKDSAIQAVNEGRSGLELKRKGEIHHAAGLRYGVGLTRTISAGGSELRAFNDVYGGNYAPDMQFFYEYQPWHSEWFGNLGLFAQVGVNYFHGNGSFQVPITDPSTGQPFSTPRTQFQFFGVPAVAGLNYRFNLLRYVRPFAGAGPALIGYYERRSDERDPKWGNSRGVFFTGGVSILLDWLSRGSTWDLYADHGVKHYYLTVDYSALTTFSGDVRFTINGAYAGLTFEF